MRRRKKSDVRLLKKKRNLILADLPVHRALIDNLDKNTILNNLAFSETDSDSAKNKGKYNQNILLVNSPFDFFFIIFSINI